MILDEAYKQKKFLEAHSICIEKQMGKKEGSLGEKNNVIDREKDDYSL